MRGIDATAGWTAEGPATVCVAVDHVTAECVGIHAARRGTRFAALEPLRQGIRAHSDGHRGGVAAGPALRHDRGSRLMSDHFRAELRLLEIAGSPAFVRTRKGRLLWIEPFGSVEALRQALLASKDRYNTEWLIERHGHQTQAAVRAASAADVAA